MGVTQRRSLLVGLSLLALAVLMLEVALVRTCAAVFGADKAAFVASLGGLTLGLGALVVAALPRLGRTEGLLLRASRVTAVASAAASLSVIAFGYATAAKTGFSLRIASDAATSGAHSALLWGAVLAAVLSPLLLAGAATAMLFRGAARSAGVAYFAYLAGGAVGCLAALAAVRGGAPRAVLFAAVVLAASAAAFLAGSRVGHRALGRTRMPGLSLVATALLGTGVVLAGDIGAPWLTVAFDVDGTPDRGVFRRWSELGQVSVDRPTSGRAALSEDGEPIAPMIDSRAQPPVTPEDMAYALHRDMGPVLILDAGGGRDVRAALKAGQKEIVAIVLHPATPELVLGETADLGAEVLTREGVTLLVGDVRSGLDALPRDFRSVVIASGGAWAQAPVDPAFLGGLTATRRELRTREAFSSYLDHLVPEGTLVATGPKESLRLLVALAEAALRDHDEPDPDAHLFGCQSNDGVALLVKRAALVPAEIRTLRRYCRQQKLSEVFAPDETPDDEARPGFEAADAASIRVATDDRPIATQLGGGLVDLFKRTRAHTASSGEEAMVWSLVVTLSALALALLWALSRPRPATVEGPFAARIQLFFALFGVAIAFFEAGIARQLVVLLGHPIYALTVIFPALLVSLGLGSLLSGSVDRPQSGRIAWHTLIGCVILVALGVAFRLGAVDLGALPFRERLVASLALLCLLGVLLGGQVPLGARVADAVSPPLTAWCWALLLLGGAAGAAASSLVVVFAGYSALFVFAAALLFAGAVVVPDARADKPIVRGGPQGYP